ncbi:hypothetical protein [Streptomyces mirabilis]
MRWDADGVPTLVVFGLKTLSGSLLLCRVCHNQAVFPGVGVFSTGGNVALFRRRSSDGPDWVTDLPGASRAERRFYQTVIKGYLDMITVTGGVRLGQAGTWDEVQTLAIVHNNKVKQAAFDHRGVDITSPAVQAGLRIGLDQFAARYGVRGSLVRAWGFADAFNRGFKAQWQPSDRNRVYWWAEQPISFACILHPAKEGEALVDGLLLYDHVTYEFTPDSEHQEQVRWSRQQVHDVDEPMGNATTLHLDLATGYSRADIASEAWVERETPAGPVFTDPSKPQRRMKPRRNWGGVG